MQQVRTDRWRGMPLVPLLQELERQVEEANPGEGEERVSFLCHRRLRKLAAALELGWELELLGPDAGERVGEETDYAALLERLDTLGPTKLHHYRRIRFGERNRKQLVEQDWGDARGITLEEYGQAVGAQRSAIWHQEAMASAIQALRDAGASRILDIGSSYNPLQGEFPEVTAVDLVPAGPSVLQADFLEVPLRDGIGAALLEPSDPQRCAALPLRHFDGAVLSHVLRSMPTRRERRLAIARAAQTLRFGGVLVIAELGGLDHLLFNNRRPPVPPWGGWGLERTAQHDLSQGAVVSVLVRLGEVGANEAEDPAVRSAEALRPGSAPASGGASETRGGGGEEEPVLRGEVEHVVLRLRRRRRARWAAEAME